MFDEIYEAALVPERWVDVPDAIGSPSGSRGGALISIQAQGKVDAITTSRFSEMIRDWTTDAEAQLVNVRPARALARLHAGWLTDLDVMTRDEVAQDLNYTRHCRRAGVAWTAGTILPLPDGRLLVFDLGRSAELGPYDAAAIHQLDAIRPHLARAAMMSARLGLDGARAMAESLALLAGAIPFQPPSD